MKREELKYFDCNEDSYDSCGFKFEPMEVYEKSEADSVMDGLEAEIKELKRANRAHLIELGDAEECFKAKEACIKELEADKLRQENYCESLVNENKRLNEIIISKDMVGAELHNENKELKQKLETRIAMWEHERNLRKDEEILFTDGEFILEKVK